MWVLAFLGVCASFVWALFGCFDEWLDIIVGERKHTLVFLITLLMVLAGFQP